MAVNVANTDYFQNEILATGFDLPTTFEFLPDGRMLVAELQGQDQGPAAALHPALDPGLFLQITNIGSAGVQQGIYDLVLDPNFATNRYYYVFYTLGSPEPRPRLAVHGQRALTGTVPGSEFVLYEDPQNADAEHHGGALNFANDGKLLFTTGEHFIPSLSPLLTSPRGKVHRINTDGTIPTDNPFYDGVGTEHRQHLGSGPAQPVPRLLRPADRPASSSATSAATTTPPRSRRSTSGSAGANYGWPDSEGPCSAPCTQPAVLVPAQRPRCRGHGRLRLPRNAVPEPATAAPTSTPTTPRTGSGACSSTPTATSPTPSTSSPPTARSTAPTATSSISPKDPMGRSTTSTSATRTSAAPSASARSAGSSTCSSNQAPVVSASANPTSGPTPLEVSFSSSGSSDPEGQPLTYSWSFGDGTTSTAANPSHTYPTAGTYQVRLTVSDGVNESTSTPITISAGDVPSATILSPTDGLQFQAGDVINYSGDGSDPDDGTLPASAFTWNIDFLHEGHVHPGTPITGVRSGSFTIPTSGHDFSGNTRYRITLTVRDSTGLTSTKSVIVQPKKVNLSFDTVPSGRTLYLDGIAKVTPFVHDTLVGFNHTIEARNQTAGNTSYTFGSWSDGGGAAAHDHGPRERAELHRDVQLDPASHRAGGRLELQRRVRHDRRRTPRAAATTGPSPAPAPPGPRRASTAAACRSTVHPEMSPCPTRPH